MSTDIKPSQRELFRVSQIAALISFAFILIIFILDELSIAHLLRYLLLFGMSFAFSSFLFLKIFSQAKKMREDEQKLAHTMLTSRIIQAQEDERKRLSRELHDSIGQSLFSVLLGIEYLYPMLQEENALKHVDQLRRTTKQTLEEIRHMAVELRPSVLDDLGLLAALKSYIKTFSDTFGIQIAFEYNGDKERFSAAVEIALYRITQEALTNAAKYADTERIDIRLFKDVLEVRLSVRDYGKGFSPEEVRKHCKGVGLYGMKERASILDGTFDISSSTDKGTEVQVRIPLENKSKRVGRGGRLV